MASSQDVDTTPAVPAPSGTISNLNDPTNLHVYSIITVSLSLSFSIPLVAARLYSKAFIQREFKIEDWLLIAAELSFIAYLGLLVALPGQGAHEWNVSITTANDFAFLVNVLELVYIIPLLLSKTALLLQLKRIFTAGSAIRNISYYALQTLIALNIAAYCALVIWALVFITRQNQDFDPTCTGECHNSNYVLVATGIFNAAIDLVTIFVPIWSIRTLQMSLLKKAGVTAIFGVGCLACAMSILRAITSFYPIDNEVDQTHTSFPLFYWAAGEIVAVLAAACIPCLPKLWKEIRKTCVQRGDGEDSSAFVASYSLRRRIQNERKSREPDPLSTLGATIWARDLGAIHQLGPDDETEDVDVAYIHGRMRGLNVGMGTTPHIEGNSPMRRQSLENRLRQIPDSELGMTSFFADPSPSPGAPAASRRESQGILKTIEVEVDISRI